MRACNYDCNVSGVLLNVGWDDPTLLSSTSPLEQV